MTDQVPPWESETTPTVSSNSPPWEESIPPWERVASDTTNGEKPGGFSSAFTLLREKGPAAGIMAASEQEMPSDEAGDPEGGLTDEQMDVTPEWLAKAEAYKKQKISERDQYMQGLERKYTTAWDEGGLLDRAGVVAGTVLGAFADPIAIATTPIGGEGALLAAGRLVKLATVGAGYEASANVLEQATRHGEVTDWGEVAGHAALGAVGYPLGDVVIRGIARGVASRIGTDGKALSKLNHDPDGIFKPKELEVFNNKLNQLQDEIHRQIAGGVRAEDALIAAEKNLDLDPTLTMHMMNATGKEIVLPKPHESAAALEVTAKNAVAGQWAATKFAKDLLTPIISRIKDIDISIWHSLRKFSLDSHQWHHRAITLADDMARALDKVGKPNTPVRGQIESALRNGEFNTAKRLFDSVGVDSRKALQNHRAAVKEFADGYREVFGKKFTPVAGDYVPRVIKDFDGFMKALGREERGFINEALDEAVKKAGRPLADSEKTQVISNALFRGMRPGKARPDATFKRRWEKIPEHMQQYYKDYREAMHDYIKDGVTDISKRRFLGKFAKDSDKLSGLDYEASIASMIEKRYKYLNADQQIELKSYLQSLLYMGDRSPSRFYQFLRNSIYTMKLSNIITAFTNLRDIGMSMKHFGFADTARVMFGGRAEKVASLGITDAAQEMVHSPSRSARWMEWSLKKGGFNKADVYGKEVILNAALRKYQKASMTAKGVQEIAAKYGKAFGEDYPALLEALQKGKVTQDVKLLLFHELSDLQPISRLEMPKKWLDHPDGRVLYALRTFQLRQLDTILRNTVGEFRTGFQNKNYKQMRTAMKNTAVYAFYLNLAGVPVQYIQDIMANRQPSLETLPEKMVDNILQVFPVISRYNLEKLSYSKGFQKPSDGLMREVGGSAGAPFDTVGRAFYDMAQGKFDKSRALADVPIIGKLYYQWLGGGVEATLKKGEEPLYRP